MIFCDAGGNVSWLWNLWLLTWFWGRPVTRERSHVNFSCNICLKVPSQCLLLIILITIFYFFCSWSFNFLFYNRKLKRIVTFRLSCFRWVENFITFIKCLGLHFVCIKYLLLDNVVCGSNLIGDGFSFDEMLDEYDEEIFADMDIWVNTMSIMLAYPNYHPPMCSFCNIRSFHMCSSVILKIVSVVSKS